MRCIIVGLLVMLNFGLIHGQEEEAIPDLTADPKLKTPTLSPNVPLKKVDKTELKLPGVTLSVTKAFELYGGDAASRSQLVIVAESVFAELHMELKGDELHEIKSPIQVELVGDPRKKSEGPAFVRRFGTLATGERYLRLGIHLERKFDQQSLRTAFAEMIILERCLSVQKSLPDDLKLVVHPWLVDGLLEVMDWRAKRSERRDYASLSKNPKLFDLARLLEVQRQELEKMDAASVNSYRAASGAMVMALLNHPDGLEKMRDMLEELSLFQGDIRNLLKRYFPEVNKGKNGLRVAWLLQLNEMSMAPLTDSLTILETEKRIDEALEFRYLNDEGVQQVLGITDFEALAKVDDLKRRSAVALASKKLVQLNYRCFPLYRPMLFRYGTILNALSQGATKGVGEAIHVIAQERGLQEQAALRARDYLDWFSIDTASSVAGDFKGFDKLNSVKGAAPGQNKTMGGYLDRLEKLYSPRK